MKKELSENEKRKRAEKLARRMALLIFMGVIGILMLGILVFCERFRATPKWIGVSLVMTVMISTIIIVELHCSTFPKRIKYYPSYSSEPMDCGYELRTKEFGVEAKICTAKRVKGGCLAIVLTLLFSILMNIFWPLGTISKEIPIDFSYVDNKIVSDELGMLAITDESGNHVWICASIESYGPCKFANTPEDEIILRRVIAENIYKLDESAPFSNRLSEKCLLVKFSHYEDGDWIIVKQFMRDQNMDSCADGAALFTLQMTVEDDQISYSVFNFKERSGQVQILTNATDGFLSWEDTKEGLVWKIWDEASEE